MANKPAERPSDNITTSPSVGAYAGIFGLTTLSDIKGNQLKGTSLRCAGYAPVTLSMGSWARLSTVLQSAAWKDFLGNPTADHGDGKFAIDGESPLVAMCRVVHAPSAPKRQR